MQYTTHTATRDSLPGNAGDPHESGLHVFPHTAMRSNVESVSTVSQKSPNLPPQLAMFLGSRVVGIRIVKENFQKASFHVVGSLACTLGTALSLQERSGNAAVRADESCTEML
jgi:hypothetical protein